MEAIEDSVWYETIFDNTQWLESLMEELEYSCEDTVQSIEAFGSDVVDFWSRFSQQMVDLDLTRHSCNFIASEERFYDEIPVAEVRNIPDYTYVSDGEEEEDSDGEGEGEGEGEEIEEERPNIEHWAMCVSKIPKSLNQEEEEDDGFNDQNTTSRSYDHEEEDENTEEEIGTSDDDEEDLLVVLEGYVDVKEEEINMPFNECDWVYVKRII